MTFPSRHEMKPWRSRTYLDAANFQSCVICEESDGTVVSCHLPLMGAAPAGTGQKCSDIISVHCCRKCHVYLDGEGRKDYHVRLMAICRTLIRNVDDGLLVVNG